MSILDLRSLNNLAQEVHGDNVAAGWWHDMHTGESLIGRRNIGELLCLVHSELDEGYFGHMNNLNDDKLPHRPMLEVELADAVIRILDIIGSKGGVPSIRLVHYPSPNDSIATKLMYIHGAVTNAMEGFRKGQEEHGLQNLFAAIRLIQFLSTTCEYDLSGAIAEKRTFNKSRPDHKLENRLKEGGKQF